MAKSIVRIIVFGNKFIAPCKYSYLLRSFLLMISMTLFN